MKLRELPLAEELTTNWANLIEDYLDLADDLIALEARIKRMAEVYPLNERETAIRDSISNLLDQEVSE